MEVVGQYQHIFNKQSKLCIIFLLFGFFIYKFWIGDTRTCCI